MTFRKPTSPFVLQTAARDDWRDAVRERARRLASALMPVLVLVAAAALGLAAVALA